MNLAHQSRLLAALLLAGGLVFPASGQDGAGDSKGRPAPAPAGRAPERPASRPAPAEDLAALIAELGHESPERCEAAVEALVPRVRSQPASLRPALRHPDAKVRAGALRVYHQARVVLASRELGPLCSDETSEVRELAILLLARMRQEDSVAVLVRLLPAERDRRVTRQIVAGLGASGDVSAVVPLLEWMRMQDDPYLLDVAGRALQSLTSAKHGRDVRAWDAWWEKHGEALLKQREEQRARPVTAEEPPKTPR